MDVTELFLKALTFHLIIRGLNCTDEQGVIGWCGHGGFLLGTARHSWRYHHGCAEWVFGEFLGANPTTGSIK